VGEYIPTTSTINSAPRFDHNPTTGESLGLLVEEQRTNSLLKSEEFSDATWVKTNISASADVAVAPDGTTTADKLIVNNGTLSTAARISQIITKPAAATAYTFTMFAKTGDEAVGGTLQMVVVDAAAAGNSASTIFSTISGTVTLAASAGGTFSNASSDITPLADGWYRCRLSFTTGTETSLQTRVFSRSPTTGDGTRGIFIWGAQLEAGAFPTSYIPTTTATVTRSADVCSISGSNFSSWYRQDEGTVFADAQTASASANGITSLNDGTNNEAINLYRTATSAVFQVRDGNVTQAFISGTVPAGFKMSCGIGANNFAAFGNAVSLGVDTLGTLPTVDRLNVGSLSAGNLINGTIRRLTYWPTRLPNSTLQVVTQ
jgi:hypothetical protein